MNNNNNLNKFFKYDSSNHTLYFVGSWISISLDKKIERNIHRSIFGVKSIVLDLSLLEEFDVNASYFILSIQDAIIDSGIQITQIIYPPERPLFFPNVNELKVNLPKISKEKQLDVSFVTAFGSGASKFYSGFVDLVTYNGMLIRGFLTLFYKPKNLYVAGVAETIYSVGSMGMWMCAILCFLIGVNLTFQMAPQFVSYGANIYVVNFLGITLLREVTPLLTAVLIAGRSGSSITASIGTMKVQQELDVLQIMGISIRNRLLLPKLVGLLIVLPLVTVFADIASILGGMLVANSYLGVGYKLFLQQMQSEVSTNNYTVGIFKSVTFAWIIAMVSTYCGTSVQSNSDSVGLQTTKSVVLSIMLIVFFDACYAILFSLLKI